MDREPKLGTAAWVRKHGVNTTEEEVKNKTKSNKIIIKKTTTKKPVVKKQPIKLIKEQSSKIRVW